MASILVVDPDPKVLRLLDAALRLKDHAVRKAASGADALNDLDGGGIDLVITELTLPDMDGWELLSRVRRGAHEDIPLVFLTARSDLDALTRARSGGADEFVQKPISLDELLIRVDRVLEVRKLGAQTPFEGDLDQLPPADVVRMLHVQRRTGLLHFDFKGVQPAATLRLFDGHVVHAEFGSLRGEAALLAALAHPRGRFRCTAEPGTGVSVQHATLGLLLEGYRLIDLGVLRRIDPDNLPAAGALERLLDAARASGPPVPPLDPAVLVGAAARPSGPHAAPRRVAQDVDLEEAPMRRSSGSHPQPPTPPRRPRGADSSPLPPLDIDALLQRASEDPPPVVHTLSVEAIESEPVSREARDAAGSPPPPADPPPAPRAPPALVRDPDESWTGPPLPALDVLGDLDDLSGEEPEDDELLALLESASSDFILDSLRVAPRRSGPHGLPDLDDLDDLEVEGLEATMSGLVPLAGDDDDALDSVELAAVLATGELDVLEGRAEPAVSGRARVMPQDGEPPASATQSGTMGVALLEETLTAMGVVADDIEAENVRLMEIYEQIKIVASRKLGTRDVQLGTRSGRVMASAIRDERKRDAVAGFSAQAIAFCTMDESGFGYASLDAGHLHVVVVEADAHRLVTLLFEARPDLPEVLRFLRPVLKGALARDL